MLYMRSSSRIRLITDCSAPVMFGRPLYYETPLSQTGLESELVPRSRSASPRQTCSRIPGAQPPVWPPQWPGCRIRKVVLTPAAPRRKRLLHRQAEAAEAAVSVVSGGGGPCCAALPLRSRRHSLQVSWLGPVWALTAAGESGGEACV